MDSIQSFKGYGKVDPAEEQAFRRKTRKRLLILVISSVVLVAVIIGAVTGTVIHNRNNKDSSSSSLPASQTSPAASLKAVCSQTLYPDSCFASISDIDKSNTTDPEQLFKLSLQVVLDSLNNLSTLPETLKATTANESVLAALNVCETMLEEALDNLNDSISSINVDNGERLLTLSKIEDLKTSLSTTVTDQETCLDALQEFDSALSEQVRGSMKNSTEYSSNSLAIVSKILGYLADFNLPNHRKLLGASDFPEWVRHGDRKLLQGGAGNPKPNVTVAQDGTGDVKTLKEAVAMIKKKSLDRFVIYVKEGTYVENVVLDKTYWNVMIYGDGKTKSIISGSLNFVDGTPTFSTATFAIAGKGFIAKDMGFKNTAGAAKHQAVAVRSGSDLSVFYRCSFDAFQDTLYAHSNRQFYRECDITGTIDFIFGNAAVVFQSCNILPRQPMSNQFVTITAQGKKDPNQNTGISIQTCTMAPLDNLNATSYLGRPWKDFSTTVIMQSTIGAFLDPQGWIEWVSGVVPPNTINYAEYLNTGPGAGVAKRVKWAGYKPALTAAQASKFTVQSFISGADWLPKINVMFQSSL